MFFRYALPALAWTGIITVLTLLPGKDLPEVSIVNFDKMAHLGVFGLLAFLYLRWQALGQGLNTSVKTIILSTIAYGGLIEILQGTFYTDRHADVIDFIANTAGVILGWLTFRIMFTNSR
jgi:VanZ family protein